MKRHLNRQLFAFLALLLLAAEGSVSFAKSNIENIRLSMTDGEDGIVFSGERLYPEIFNRATMRQSVQLNLYYALDTPETLIIISDHPQLFFNERNTQRIRTISDLYSSMGYEVKVLDDILPEAAVVCSKGNNVVFYDRNGEYWEYESLAYLRFDNDEIVFDPLSVGKSAKDLFDELCWTGYYQPNKKEVIIAFPKPGYVTGTWLDKELPLKENIKNGTYDFIRIYFDDEEKISKVVLSSFYYNYIETFEEIGIEL